MNKQITNYSPAYREFVFLTDLFYCLFQLLDVLGMNSKGSVIHSKLTSSFLLAIS